LLVGRLREPHSEGSEYNTVSVRMDGFRNALGGVCRGGRERPGGSMELLSPPEEHINSLG